MNRVLLLMMGGAASLLVGTAANAATKIEQAVLDVAPGDLRMDSRITVTTEQATTDPLIPMLVTRVQVDEMAVAAPAPASELAAGTARVESAGKDGGLPIRTAHGAGFLASGLVLRLWRRRG